MAATYATATVIAAWTNPSYATNKQYNVIPYIANSVVTADQHLAVVDLATAQDIFQKMLNDAINGAKHYDQVIIQEQLVNCPS